jgi:Arc/MetJ-type ribon-helix-helix transcriptional regulator
MPNAIVGNWNHRGEHMTITIRSEDEQLIAQAMQTGAYSDPGEVIGRALEVLRSEDRWLYENQAAVCEKIDRAMAQVERGEVFLPEQSRADMEQRKAHWLRERQG